jgi:hypothetical protein
LAKFSNFSFSKCLSGLYQAAPTKLYVCGLVSEKPVEPGGAVRCNWW